MKPVELIQRINALHQTAFTLLEKYPDGEQGAFAVTDQLSRRWVKWMLYRVLCKDSLSQKARKRLDELYCSMSQ